PEDQSDLESTGRKRICQLGWFTKFKWLSYCKSKKKVYCYFCRYAYFGGFHPEINKIGETSLTFAGYEDWKNALARFVKHESGKIQSDCVYLVKQQQKPTVAARLSLAHEKQQTERRKMFLVQVECVKYLSRQGLAIRGHVENEGNLIQLLKLREADVHGLDSWVEDGNYLSHDIINEICQIISLTIIHEIIKEISERKFYSIICDATSDESDIEQLCFTIRSVDKDFIVHEDVLGLYAITSETAEHITRVILDILIRCTLNLKYCRGQAYDGAPATAGHISDLVLQDLSRGSFAISDALDMTKDIVNFIKESPKRLNLLDVISGSDHYYKLKPLCPTRWTVRASSMNLLIINYSLVKTTLGAISEEGGRPAAKANGWQEKMEKFSSYFGLKLAHLIFSATETVSCSLQRVDNNVQDILCAIDTLINYLTRIKTDDYFKTFYEGIRDDAKSLTDEPILLRIRKPPSRFDFLSSATHYENVYESYRHQYFDIINKILNFLDLRFNQSVFPLLCKVEKLLLLAANGMKDDDIICLNDINEFLIDDINVERLQHELPMLSDYFSRINNEKNLGIKQITKISTICQLLNTYQIFKYHFSFRITMPAKQTQIMSFFQNKKRKIHNSFDGNSLPVDTSSTISNETQEELELCEEIPSFEPPTISAPVSPTAAPSRTTSSTTVLSAPSSPTTILSRLTLSTSPPSIPTSTKIASSAPTSPIQKLKCELACCTSEYPFVPEDQSDLESTGRKRICQLGWFTKFKWLSYCKVRNNKDTIINDHSAE
ncbi:unnamed protein product, partial [Rotaria sp. Silwood2]